MLNDFLLKLRIDFDAKIWIFGQNFRQKFNISSPTSVKTNIELIESSLVPLSSSFAFGSQASEVVGWHVG